MELIVLGSGTSVFHPQRSAAAFWLETEGGSILLDCSADAPHRMAEENLDWPNLDAIWISHLHLDHCAGLAPFLFGVKYAPQTQQRKKTLRIFACVGVEKFLKAIDESHNYGLLDQHFPIELCEIAPAQANDSFEIISGVSSAAFSTPHRPESLAIRVADPHGVSLVYTSDTGFSKELAGFAQAADLLILECSFYRDKPTRKHLELADAMRVAQLAEPKKLMLTHLYPEWDSVELAAAAKRLWNGVTIEARDGLRLEVTVRH